MKLESLLNPVVNSLPSARFIRAEMNAAACRNAADRQERRIDTLAELFGDFAAASAFADAMAKKASAAAAADAAYNDAFYGREPSPPIGADEKEVYGKVYEEFVTQEPFPQYWEDFYSEESRDAAQRLADASHAVDVARRRLLHVAAYID